MTGKSAQTAKFTIHKLLGDEVEKNPLMEVVGMDAAKEITEEMNFHTKVVIVRNDGEIFNYLGQKIEMDVDWLHGDEDAKTVPVRTPAKAKTKKTTETKAKASTKAKEPAETKPKTTKGKKPKVEEVEPAPADPKDDVEVVVEEKPVRNPTKKTKKVDIDETIYAGDFLMWVGSSSNPTVSGYIEASKNGLGKKLSKLPRDMKLDESRILLAHDEGETGDAIIFGYYVINKITLLVKGEEEEVPEAFMKDPRVTILTAKEGQEPGLYAIGSKLEVLEKPLDYNALIKQSAKRFRSYMRVDGPGLLNSEMYKAAPVERSEVEVALPEGYEKPQANQDWSDEERQALWDHAHHREDKARAFREFCRVTGRTPQGVSYQYYRMKSKAEKAPEAAAAE